MPGIELSGERRLLILWLVLSLLFGLAYYLGVDGRHPFVQRFERAYYDVFWSRPFLSTAEEGLEVGIIAPQYISSLIDSEMWVWVRNKSVPAEPTVNTETDQGANEAPSEAESAGNPSVLSPLIVVDYTPKISLLATSSPTLTTASTTLALQSPIEAQVLLREGENLTDYYTDSRSTISFSDIYPGETAARLVWVRLMPQAYSQGIGDPSLSIYLSEREITGTIEFGYTLWESPTTATGALDFEGNTPPEATINTRQAVMRGFARTLLLPPWSNGLLIGLGLISAFMINSVVNFVDLRLAESESAMREERRNRSSFGLFDPTPENKGSWGWQLLFWCFQIAFWACAVISVFILVGRLTEYFILCPMIEVASIGKSAPFLPLLGEDIPSGVHIPGMGSAIVPVEAAVEAGCVEWGLWPSFFLFIALAIPLFYAGYLWQCLPFRSTARAIREEVSSRVKRRPRPVRVIAHQPVTHVALNQITISLQELTQLFRQFASPHPSSIDLPTLPGNLTTDPDNPMVDPGNPTADLGNPAADPGDTPDPPQTLDSGASPTTPGTADADEIARKGLKKLMDDLTDEIVDLHKDLMRDNISSLDTYEILATVYRDRNVSIDKMVSTMSPEAKAGWKRKRKGPRLLKEIDKSLDQLVGYISLAKPVKDLSDSIRNGDPTGLDRLMEIRTQLAGDSRQLNLEPARSLAEKTVTQIEETERYYQEHFVDLHTNIVDDSSLVGVLDKLIILRNKEGSVVYVRFFSDSEDVFNDRTERMYLSQAYDIAIGRLSGYRLRLLREKEDKFQTILGFDRTSEGDKQRALSDLNSLLDEIRGWPDSLHGYKEYPESAEGEDSFPRRVDTLKRNISETISVLLAELE